MARHASHTSSGSDVSRARHARPAQQPYGSPSLELPDPRRPSGFPASASESQRFSRSNYGTGAAGQYAHAASRGMSAAKKVGIGVLAAIGVALLAAAVYLVWFANALNTAIAPSNEDRALLADQLVESPLNQPFYMLLLGSDSREGANTSTRADEQGDQQRSDVIILARIDAPRKQVTLVSVPRDTPYTLDDGTVVKINEAYNIGGAAMSVKAVSEVTGVNIAHYAEVRVSELVAIVDAVGGIEVDVDRDLEVKDTLTGKSITVPAGHQTLTGLQAEAFARDRHAYGDAEEGQDNRRQSNVRMLLQAIIKKALDRPVVELPGVVLELAQYVTCDLSAGDLVSLALSFAGGGITMYSCAGPSAGDINEQYNGMWLCYPNPEGWAELMRQVDSGAQPQEIDYEATQIVP